MAIINHNSISGVTTVSVGSSIVVGDNLVITSNGLDNITQINATGVITATSFSGALTGNVTGSATALSGTPDVTVGTLNVTDAIISGDLTVQGTTTTLDTVVTEVDKLEVDANNTTVGVAITQSGTGDILNLYDGSTEVFTVTDGGSVGIGTDNPSVKLHTIGDVMVQGTGGVGEQSLFIGKSATVLPNSRGVAIVADQNSSAYHDMVLKTSTNSSGLVERLRITSTGNVGIKTTIPNNTLTVSDTVQPSYAPSTAGNYIEIARTSGADAGLLINKNTGQWLIGIDNSDGANSPLRFEYGAAGSAHPGFGAGTLGMIMQHDGDIGIGTDNPTTKLEIQSAASDSLDNPQSILIQDTNTAGQNKGPGITFGYNYSASGNYINRAAQIKCIKENATDNNYATALIFGTTSHAASTTERLRIGSSGQIGLGGANYGTSGQVLTSQGSSAAPQWATVATGTSTDATSLTSTGTVFDFASNTSDIIILTFNFTLSTNTELRLRVGDTTSGTVNAGYKYYCVKDGVNNPSSSNNHDKFLLMTSSNTFGTYEFFGNMTLARAGGSGWSQSFRISTPSTNTLTGSGLLTSAGNINRIHLFTSGATLGGYIGATWH